jgi:hypothetical protein
MAYEQKPDWNGRNFKSLTIRLGPFKWKSIFTDLAQNRENIRNDGEKTMSLFVTPLFHPEF